MLSKPARTRNQLLFLLALCWLTCSAEVGTAASLEQRCYRQQNGSQSHYFTWVLEKSDPLRLQTAEPGERFNLEANAELATLNWKLQRPAEQTRLRVERRGNQLVWSGTLKGRPLARRDEIDDAPWYQALSLSLQQLLGTDRKELSFWMVRPDTLKIYKLRAERRSPTNLELAGKSIPCVPIRLTVPGIPSFIWHSDYWFDARDGRFLRFAGRTGLPGCPDTVVELQTDAAGKICSDPQPPPTAATSPPTEARTGERP